MNNEVPSRGRTVNEKGLNTELHAGRCGPQSHALVYGTG